MPTKRPMRPRDRSDHDDAPEAKLSVRALLMAGLSRAIASTDWVAISAATRIVLPIWDEPMREVITGRRVGPSGMYPSRKAGRPLAFESMNERAVFIHSEVDTEIANYLSQPCRFEFVLDGVKRSYVPDCARILADGTLEIVEVKGDRRDLSDPDYLRKLDHVSQACRKMGWSFRVVFGAPLRAKTVRNRTIQLIQHHRLTRYGAQDVFLIHSRLSEASNGLPLGDLARALGDEVVGRAMICAMMVGRELSIDLDAPLSPASCVRLRSAKCAVAAGGEGVL